MSQTGATLSGSYSGASATPTVVGFKYGTTSGNLTQTVTATDNSGSFSTNLTGLTAGTTYYYKAYVTVNGTGDYSSQSETFYGNEYSFTTTAASSNIPTGWLELPEVTGSEDLVLTMYKTGGITGTDANRNYTMNYSKDRYAALWVAYTLTENDVIAGNTGSKNWDINSYVFDGSYQVGVTSNSYPSTYNNASSYARGHQIPNADRTSTTTANNQTYLVTNQTPQLQDKFNASIWSALEKAGRGFVVTQSSNTANYNSTFTKTDVLYVITGPCYGKAGTSETPSYLTSKGTVSPTQVPIPKYYWKVFLKVRWNGNAVDEACAIGFWFVHQEYDNSTYTNYIQSVNQIETWTGFNLFANLPDSIEETVESNTNWDTFRTF